jgi:hypothetical protein
VDASSHGIAPGTVWDAIQVHAYRKRTVGCFGDLAAQPGSVVPDYGAVRFRFELLLTGDMLDVVVI